MKSVDELVQELSETTQPIDIPHLDLLISKVDFDAAKKAAGEGEVSRGHLKLVYDTATRFERSEEIVEAVAGLQFHYEIIHQVRLQLQRQFADAYLGDKKSVVLERKIVPDGRRSPGIKFTRWHFETFSHPSYPYNDSGFYYFGSTDAFISILQKSVKNEQMFFLADVAILNKIEVAYYIRVYNQVNDWARTILQLSK